MSCAPAAHFAQLELGRPLVHIVDREGDSIGHYRQWQEHHFLVRAKGGQRVAWDGTSVLLCGVARALKPQLRCCREVEWHGRAVRQYVGETRVGLTRRTRQKRLGQKPRSVAGEPVTLRLIVSEVRAEDGRVLAQWLLLSNVPARVDAGRLALWYYWRWRIESFFKLLKGAGQHVEHWQQASAAAAVEESPCLAAMTTLQWVVTNHWWRITSGGPSKGWLGGMSGS